MPVPQVAIVGRPNVGKSSLFNWLAGRRLAIVDPTAGVTRDRMSFLMDVDGRFFEIIDTGGMGIKDSDDLTKEVESQIDAAMDVADLILFVVDTREGIVPLDEEVARRLRYIDKPILCVANKTDHPSLETQASEFYKLGCKVITISVHQMLGKADLLEQILAKLPKSTDIDAPSDSEMKVAIVGRRNVGKSTFVNTLAQAERMIVSEIPGTTRDSVDVRFELDGKVFTAIDTPGLRRTKSIRTDIDFYGSHRAQRSIRRADVVLLFFDCTQRLSKVDKQLCQYINEQFKPCIFVVNKWDQLANQRPTEVWVNYLRDNFPTMAHAPIAFITGQTGRNVKALLNHAQHLFKQARERIGTGELNRLVRNAVERNAPPMYGMMRPKIFYATQVGVQPPTIVLMCNEPKAFAPNYRRYLLNELRDNLPFSEIPVKLYLHRRRRTDNRDELKMPGPDTIEQEQDLDEVHDHDALDYQHVVDDDDSGIYEVDIDNPDDDLTEE